MSIINTLPACTVSQITSEDEGVLVSLREGLLQCVSWVAIQQYLSRGRLTSRVNWLNIIHSKDNIKFYHNAECFNMNGLINFTSVHVHVFNQTLLLMCVLWGGGYFYF